MNEHASDSEILELLAAVAEMEKHSTPVPAKAVAAKAGKSLEEVEVLLATARMKEPRWAWFVNAVPSTGLQSWSGWTVEPAGSEALARELS